MRHGKASQEVAGTDDFDRQLVEIGKMRTQRVARELLTQNVIPQLIISSPALRAIDTSLCMAEVLGISPEKVITDKQLYFRSVNDYFAALYSAPDEVDTLLITGHNPLVTEFANFFLRKKIDGLPTSGLVALQSKTDSWPEFVIAYKKALFYLVPKKLENEK